MCILLDFFEAPSQHKVGARQDFCVSSCYQSGHRAALCYPQLFVNRLQICAWAWARGSVHVQTLKHQRLSVHTSPHRSRLVDRMGGASEACTVSEH